MRYVAIAVVMALLILLLSPAFMSLGRRLKKWFTKL